MPADMPTNLSYLSDADLHAIAAGDMSKVSEEGLRSLSSKTPAFDMLMRGLASNPLTGNQVGMGETALHMVSGLPNMVSQLFHGPDLSYSPRTPQGKLLSSIVDAPSEAVDALAMERANGPTDVGGYSPGPLARFGLKIPIEKETAGQSRAIAGALDAVGQGALSLAGMRAGPGAKMTQSVLNKPSGLLDVVRGNVDKIRGNYVRSVTGNAETRNALANALDKSSQVPHYPSTAADLVANKTEGTPIQALQQQTASSPVQLPNNGPAISQAFNRRFQEQAGAVDALKELRDKVTDGMRESALSGANSTAGIPGQVQNLMQTIRERFLSKASALQDKGRFDTTTADQTMRANFKNTPTGPMGRALGMGSPVIQVTKNSARSFSNRLNARADEARSASSEMPEIIQQRQAELEDARSRLSALQQSGASPLETQPLMQKVASLMQTPGYRASDVVTTVLNKIGDKLGSLADKNGVIDARDLYTVRKDMGKYIEDAAGSPGAKYDKKLAAGLQADLQSSIDDAIEAAGGKGWKAYLNTYSRLSQKAQNAVDIAESKYTPTQLTTLNGPNAATSSAQTHIPHVLTRSGTLANWALNNIRSGVQQRVTGSLGDALLHPENGVLAGDLRKGIRPTDMMQTNRIRQALAQALLSGALPNQGAQQ